MNTFEIFIAIGYILASRGMVEQIENQIDPTDDIWLKTVLGEVGQSVVEL